MTAHHHRVTENHTGFRDRTENTMSAAIKPSKSEPGAVATGSNQETRLPNSRRIYIAGQQPGVRVPFREIDQSPTRNFDNTLEQNPPVRVYDSSGPWGDPAMKCDVRDGLSALRSDWIVGRGDVEEYDGRDLQPIDDGYLTRSEEHTSEL